MFWLQAEHRQAAGQIFAVFKGRDLLAQLLCHTSRLLTSACKEAIIMLAPVYLLYRHLNDYYNAL